LAKLTTNGDPRILEIRGWRRELVLFKSSVLRDIVMYSGKILALLVGCFMPVYYLAYTSTLNMEAIFPFEMSDYMELYLRRWEFSQTLL
jgi:hypothetical protein